MCKSFEYVECKDCECWTQKHPLKDKQGPEMGLCRRHAPRPQTVATRFVVWSIKDVEDDDTMFGANEPEKILSCFSPSRVICTTLYNEGCFEGLYKKGLWEEREQEHKETGKETIAD